MSRYIDADAFCDSIKVLFDWLCNEDSQGYKTAMIIREECRQFPAADVVSREQYNQLYEEKLELQRTLEKAQCLNSHLMDVLHELGDDGK